MGYFDDFYEPSEFDMQVDEWKSMLRESVKKEYQQKLDEAYKEIAELKEYRDNKIQYERQIQQMKNETERIKRDAKQQASKERLDELFKNIQVPAWIAYSDYTYAHEKCDKCDSDGYIHFKSPSGRDMKEECDCRKRKYVYSPKEARCFRIYTRGNNLSDVNFTRMHWVQTRKELTTGNSLFGTSGIWEPADCDYAHVMYNGESFDDISHISYKVYFLNKEDCEKFCDYLNSKEE